jgi:uncharacterized protein
MLEIIEKLLILQDRDRKISRIQSELANIDPERTALDQRSTSANAKLEAARLKLRQIEADRNKLELEVQAKKQQIEKYSLQQFQTKKNEEYRALAHEIENCKAAIVRLDDQQLELMEQADAAQKESAIAAREAEEARKILESQKAALDLKEEGLEKELADLQSNYDQLTAAVGDESVLARYQRLRKQKGDSTVAGVERSVCGGCHMKLPMQVVVTCQGQRELVNCPNCGRILYYAPHMDLAVVD